MEEFKEFKQKLGVLTNRVVELTESESLCKLRIEHLEQRVEIYAQEAMKADTIYRFLVSVVTVWMKVNMRREKPDYPTLAAMLKCKNMDELAAAFDVVDVKAPDEDPPVITDKETIEALTKEKE